VEIQHSDWNENGIRNSAAVAVGCLRKQRITVGVIGKMDLSILPDR
jgi:hypothetical protein